MQSTKSQPRAKKNEFLKGCEEVVKSSLSPRSLRVAELPWEKGASSWLTVIPIKDQGYDLNKREFKDAIKMRYNWEISDLPKTCVCGDIFDVDHAVICKRGGFVIQRHKMSSTTLKLNYSALYAMMSRWSQSSNKSPERR